MSENVLSVESAVRFDNFVTRKGLYIGATKTDKDGLRYRIQGHSKQTGEVIGHLVAHGRVQQNGCRVHLDRF